jgi:4'-phosphopantetheinyl transferase EntD
VVGSITHCPGYRASAVALARDVAAIGIDAEPCMALADGLLMVVAGDAERAWLAELSTAGQGTPWDRVLFSAKESVYKAWYPHTSERPCTPDITIRIGQAGTFAATLPRDSAAPPVARLIGRWLVRRGLIVTAVSIPP